MPYWQLNCWSLRCRWNIACRRSSNYIFILDLTPGFNGLSKDNCKMRRETFKFWDLMSLILRGLKVDPISCPLMPWLIELWGHQQRCQTSCHIPFVWIQHATFHHGSKMINRQTSNIKHIKSQKLKCFLSCNCLSPIYYSQVLNRERRCTVVGAAPTGDAPTTSEWSTIFIAY